MMDGSWGYMAYKLCKIYKFYKVYKICNRRQSALGWQVDV